jgi:hypothetical protein
MRSGDNMRRVLEFGESPSDVIKKIDSFIGNEDNTNGFMDNIGVIMKGVDRLENIVNNIGDERYRNEMLGYITMVRQYVTSALDAFDSMMEI